MIKALKYNISVGQAVVSGDCIGHITSAGSLPKLSRVSESNEKQRGEKRLNPVVIGCERLQLLE
jgi:hypothetical protein